ncbi:ExeM/NucH family extracellular endonuclease [Saprospiraceae bacterium]|nr:ExeM/NucH family extracellular endonuclease [Saprospiraceae bacterium]
MLIKKAIFLLTLSLTILSGYSQTTLTQGDIVIISISGDNKTFRFVPLIDLSADTEIYFTDSGWIGPGFRANEGAVKYTVPAGGILAGSNIEYLAGASNFISVSDSFVGTNGFNLSSSGDQVLAFIGSTSSPNFIFASQTNSTQWQTSATNSNNSGLPSGLINGNTAVAYGSGPGEGDEYDNTWYDCSTTTGTPADVLAAVADQNNWMGDNSSYSPCSNNFFGGGGGGPAISQRIHDIQGNGATVADPGLFVSVEAVVVGDYQDNDELNGFFIQEENTDEDGDPLTSEGIFVYCNTCPIDVAEGDLVIVEGIADEFFDQSQLDVIGSNGSVTIVSSSNLSLVTPAQISLPASDATDAVTTFESTEGMLVEFSQTLVVTEHFLLTRYGQLTLSADEKQINYTQTNTPTAAGYTNHLIDRNKSRIILDDINNLENIDPVYHPRPTGFSTTDVIRGGSTINNLTGVMSWSFAGSSNTNAWRIRPTTTMPVSFVDSNPRMPNPAPSADLKIASFNVLNYFNGNGTGGGFPTSRGADSNAEFIRQTDKIIDALIDMDADIIGLIEIENDYSDGNLSSIASLVNALNNATSANTYEYVDPVSNIGNDEISNGFIYKTAKVGLNGTEQILDTPEFLDPNNTGTDKNRPALAQSFEIIDMANDGYQEIFTVVVNHLKSKGSSCGAGDDDTTSGQGNCNGTRTDAALELVNWLSTDPTGSGDSDILIIGDLNAYAMEAPITTITNAGYTNLVTTYDPDAYSFVFNGEWGTLDHALSNASFQSQISNVSTWNINSDESSLLDYNDTVQDPGEQPFEVKPSTNPLYNADQYRSSDHDPIIISLSYGNCPDSLDISGVVNSGLYEAQSFITSDGLLPSPNDIIYRAGQMIELESGFEVLVGAQFHAHIGPCN